MSLSDVQGHVIISGYADSFLGFVKELRRCTAQLLPVVVLHENLDEEGMQPVLQLARVFYVKGSPTNQAGLKAAKASEARYVLH